jgi:hypothetical protein
VAPTTTTLPPLTPAERAWLKAIPTVRRKIEKSIEAVSDLTPAGMARLANAFRSCTRELVRGGLSERLQPVYVLVQKHARSTTRERRASPRPRASAFPFAGTPDERKQSKAIDCGFAAPGKAGLAIADAESKGTKVKAEAG